MEENKIGKEEVQTVLTKIEKLIKQRDEIKKELEFAIRQQNENYAKMSEELNITVTNDNLYKIKEQKEKEFYEDYNKALKICEEIEAANSNTQLEIQE